MNSLNLDLDSYSDNNLLTLFSLKRGFTHEAVLGGKDKITKQLMKVKDLSAEQKNRIQFFIDNASTRLMHYKDKLPDQGTWAQKKNIMMEVGDDHYVIANSNTEAGKKSSITDGRLAGTLNVPPGWLNPINIKTRQTRINIDTRFRNLYYSTSSTDFQFDLPDIQKKVTHMKVMGLDIPMSFYGVSRDRGDATFIVTETTEQANDIGQFILGTHPAIVGTSEQVITLLNLSDPTNPAVYYVDSLPSSFKNYVFSYGWLVVLPDGNYECEWQSSNNSADLVSAMNNSLAFAIPGILIHNDGTFLAYGLDPTNPNLPTLNYGINPLTDLCYTVDRASGKSIFSIPVNTATTVVTSVFSTTGFRIQFAVNSGGCIVLSENIQLRLGWQIGFRAGGYTCNNLTTCVSEGVAMITGPRYLYLAIDDGLKNYCNEFIAAFSQSSLGEHVISKLNIAFSMDNVGVYKSASDIGISNPDNLRREYFGPGTITRLKIKLLDEYGRIVSLNHMDWSMSIVLEKLYDS